MSGSSRSSSGLDVRRRRLLFRAWHRGIREADLILGRFADAHIEQFDDEGLAAFERLLDAQDLDLLAWVSGQAAPPPEYDTPMLRQLRDFRWQADR